MPPKSDYKKQPLIPDICPDCGAKETIILDDYSGTIECTECGIVLKGGLEESTATAFRDDQVKDTTRQQELRGAPGGDKKSLSSGERYTRQVLETLATLRTRLDVPDAVVNEAKALLPDLLAILAGGEDPSTGSYQHQPPPAEALAIALFHVSSYIQHFPISWKQCCSILHTNIPVKDLVGKIISCLKIQLPAPERTLADIVTNILIILAPQPLEPLNTIAAKMAATFDEKVTSVYEPRIVAGVSVFLAYWATSVRDKIAPRAVSYLNSKRTSEDQPPISIPPQKVWSEDDKKNLEKKITLIIRDEEEQMRSCLKLLNTKMKEAVPQWILATAEKFPKLEAPTSVESGARRERE
jgi:hypothetical protein